MLYLGIDLGGTNIKVGLVTAGGEVVRTVSAPTDLPRSAEEVCGDMVRLCREVLDDAGETAAAVGVGCPGTVDGESGRVVYSNNLRWVDFPLRDYLSARLELPVTIGNDANVAAYGEAAAGCARGAESAVILTLGTGVGGGVILGGRLLTGFTGAASELGHMVTADGGEPCTCGRKGCFETCASATALIRMTREAMAEHPESLLHTAALLDGGVSGRTAFDAAELGDETAGAVVRRYEHGLAVGIANIINIFFPEVVGLSGGVANQGEKLLVPLRAEVEPMVFGHAYAKKKTRLVGCTLGYRAGIIGGAMLARQALAED